MIIGTSKAECAVLIIDSTTGGFEAGILNDGQTREHTFLAFNLGVKKMICCCNEVCAVAYLQPSSTSRILEGCIEAYLETRSPAR
ncbi:hypothetical protein GIB67_006825 [Kingdonia uniflora]|uniref:Tr-type G domain-containing protein n=1 Tax=Kingdonia uniflora TaxID=39325 RepID=A0A7J7L004_9MAGN|nr:hypothetical protein GIB67_006825 [Kingdonia uniflora]